MPESPPPPPDPPRPSAGEAEVPAAIMGDYANFARISHMPGDFFLDFGQHLPEKNTVALKRRIVMSPVNVKSLLRALQENVSKYEERYGQIPNDPTR